MSLVDDLVALDRPLLVALDVDGTLAPIVRDPDEATIPPQTLELLKVLASAPTVEVALITGRDLESLSRMERLDGIWRGVEHGGLVVGPGEEPHVRAIAETDPDRANRLLDEAEELATRLGLHVRKGRCVREAEALSFDKGEALRQIFERSGARSVFFAGDDVTDVPAIEFANNHGIGAFVLSAEKPKPPSESMLVIESASEVAQLLAELSRRLV